MLPTTAKTEYFKRTNRNIEISEKKTINKSVKGL